MEKLWSVRQGSPTCHAEKLVAKRRLTKAGRPELKHAKHLKIRSAASFKATGKPAVSRSESFTLH